MSDTGTTSTTSDIVLYQAGSQSSPLPVGYVDATNPLHPAQRTVNRFGHFPDTVYDLSPESHISKLLKVLLGDTGVNQLQRRMLLARLQQSLGSTHFFDLDAFYGSLFGVFRRADEQLATNAFLDTVTNDEWDDLRVRDAAYRSRVEQFAKAIHLGATAAGIEVAAEAVLGVDCEVREQWTIDDTVQSIWTDIQTVGTTYLPLQAYTFAQLEAVGGRTGLNAPIKDRHRVTVYPKRAVTPEERYDLMRVLDRIRPTGTLIDVAPLASPIYEQVFPTVTFSDSEHWEVSTQVSNAPVNTVTVFDSDDNGFIDKPFVPWAKYQGEAWSYLPENPTVLAYTSPGVLVASEKFAAHGVDLPSQQYKVDGDLITFLPQYALRSLQSLMSGRLMSEGILAANPYIGLRDEPEFSTTGKLLMDGANLDSLVTAQPLKDSKNRGSLLYWTSPLRHWFATDIDIVEVRYPALETINHVSFEVSHYPHSVEVQAWSDTTGTWVTLFDHEVRDSRPYAVNGALQKGTVHPYHFGDGHWVKVSRKIDPQETTAMRFVFRRFGTLGSAPGLISIPGITDALWTSPTFPGAVPASEDMIQASIANDQSQINNLNAMGVPNDLDTAQRTVDAFGAALCSPPFGISRRFVPYPVGLRNVDTGYRLSTINDLPIVRNDPNKTIAITRNAAGQAIRHYLNRYPAANVVDNSFSYWKSEPQPVSNAVVNLYMDMRSADGSVPVIDSFFADPLATGPMLNIYWSNDIEAVDYRTATPSEDNLIPSRVVGNFSFIDPLYGIKFPNNDIAFLEFDNANLHWSATQSPWWIGALFTTSKASNAYYRSTIFASGSESPIGTVGQGDVSLRLENDSIQFNVGSVQVSLPILFPPFTPVLVAAACRPNADGSVSLTLSIKAGPESESTADPALSLLTEATLWLDASPFTETPLVASTTGTPSTQLNAPSSVRIGHGTVNDTDPYPLAVTLQSFNLTYGEPTEAFYTDPMSFARPTDYTDGFASVDRNPSSPIAGAVIRYAPKSMSTSTERTGSLVNRFGFLGGQPDIYADSTWVPVTRDYALRRGTIRIPPTAAALWKFEFTSLVAEPMETMLAIQRRVKLMPDRDTARPGNAAASWSEQTITALGLTGVSKFRDIPVVQDYTSRYGEAYGPTSGLVATDFEKATAAGRDLGFGYNLLPWQPDPLSAMFVRRGRHDYQVQWMEHVNKIGFVVGLRTLQPLRSRWSAADNTQTYVDHLWDLENVASTTMAFTSGAFYTTSGPQPILLNTPQVVTSDAMESIQPVVAVQFATQQSEAMQLLSDDKFESPSLPAYRFDSVDSWQFDGDASAFYDAASKSVTVTRDTDVASTLTGGLDPINREPIDPVLATTRLLTPNMVSASYGGLKSASVTVSPQGVLHAACRVLINEPLRAPLVLQIIGSDSTTVLAESSFTPDQGVLTEHTLAYVIGSVPGLDATVTARIIQKGPYRATWHVHALSLFDDGYLWEFSNNGGASWVPAYDVRNNQEGVVRFASPGTSLRWRFTGYRRNIVLSMVKIKPWYEGKALGRQTFPQRGPNLSIYDDDLPIQDDPDFTAWTNPIPQSWFARFRSVFTIDTETLYGSLAFARTFVRLAEDIMSGQSDAASIAGFGATRSTSDALSTADAATTSRTFTRSAADTAPVTDAAFPWVPSDGIIQPVIDPPD